MFPVSWYQKTTNAHQYAMGFLIVSLQNSVVTDAHCSQEAAETRGLLGLLVVSHNLRLSVI